MKNGDPCVISQGQRHQQPRCRQRGWSRKGMECAQAHLNNGGGDCIFLLSFSSFLFNVGVTFLQLKSKLLEKLKTFLCNHPTQRKIKCYDLNDNFNF